MSELTRKEALFVREYLKDLNATQAAKRCGYSLHTCRQTGARMLSNAAINEAIAEAMAARLESVKIDADYVLKKLVEQDEADMSELYDDDGAILPVNEWPEIWRTGLVDGLETETETETKDDGEITTTTRVTKIKLSPRIKRLELIGKHIAVNAFQDVVEVKGLNGLAERLERAMARTGDVSPEGDN